MCSEHLNISNYWPLVKQIFTEVTSTEQKLVSDLMFEYYQNSEKNVIAIFDVNNLGSIKDDSFKAWFGFEKNQFIKICEFTKDCTAVQVAVLLCKMRTALSNQQLAYLFGCCENTIANYLNKAREDLIMNFLPQFINNNDRSTLINHNTPMAKELFDIPDDRSCCVFDATYRLAQKSKNFAGQKHLWSEQKKCRLLNLWLGVQQMDMFFLF